MSKSIRKNFIYNFIKTLMNLIFPLVTFIYASRILGVEAIGRINFSRSFIQYFIILSTMGISSYGVREGAKLREDKSKLSKFTVEILIINVISTLISYAILIICCFTIPKLYSYNWLIAIFSSCILLNTIGMEWLYGANEDYKYIALRSVLFQAISLMMMFIFVRDADDVYAYTLIYVLSSYGSYICNFVHCWKFIDLKNINILEIKKHFKPILLLFAFTVSVSIYSVLDSTMLGFMCDDRAVGLYTAGIKLNKIVQQLITSFGVVIMPRLSYHIEKSQHDAFMYLVENSYKLILMLAFPICFGILVLSKSIIILMSGSEFSDAILTSQILVPIILFIPFSFLTNNQIMIPLKKELLMLKSTCAGAIVNFIANIVLIPIWAENGAAVATVIAECVVCVICFINARRFCNIKRIVLSCWKYPVAALPILLIDTFVGSLELGTIWNIIVVILAGGICYFSILLFLRDDFLIIQIKHIKSFLLKLSDCGIPKQ